MNGVIEDNISNKKGFENIDYKYDVDRMNDLDFRQKGPMLKSDQYTGRSQSNTNFKENSASNFQNRISYTNVPPRSISISNIENIYNPDKSNTDNNYPLNDSLRSEEMAESKNSVR